MTRQQKVLLRSAPITRRNPPLRTTGGPPQERRRVGEVAGGTTAECAAVCCCFPCAVMDLVVLAAYKVPAWLLNKTVHKRKRRRVLKKKNHALLKERPSTGSAESGNVVGATLEEHLAKDATEKSEVVELEKEMWAQFNGTGFWRSSSQRLQQQQQPHLQTGE